VAAQPSAVPDRAQGYDPAASQGGVVARNRYSVVEIGGLAYAIRTAFGMILGGIVFIIFAGIAQGESNAQSGFGSDQGGASFANGVRAIGILILVVGIVVAIVTAVYIAKRRNGSIDEGPDVDWGHVDVGGATAASRPDQSPAPDSARSAAPSDAAAGAESQSDDGGSGEGLGEAIWDEIKDQDRRSRRWRPAFGPGSVFPEGPPGGSLPHH
jgi:hypothetical protein